MPPYKLQVFFFFFFQSSIYLDSVLTSTLLTKICKYNLVSMHPDCLHNAGSNFDCSKSAYGWSWSSTCLFHSRALLFCMWRTCFHGHISCRTTLCETAEVHNHMLPKAFGEFEVLFFFISSYFMYCELGKSSFTSNVGLCFLFLFFFNP